MGSKFIPGEDIVVSICDEQMKTVKLKCRQKSENPERAKSVLAKKEPRQELEPGPLQCENLVMHSSGCQKYINPKDSTGGTNDVSIINCASLTRLSQRSNHIMMASRMVWIPGIGGWIRHGIEVQIDIDKTMLRSASVIHGQYKG